MEMLLLVQIENYRKPIAKGLLFYATPLTAGVTDKHTVICESCIRYTVYVLHHKPISYRGNSSTGNWQQQ